MILSTQFWSAGTVTLLLVTDGLTDIDGQTDIDGLTDGDDMAIQSNV